MKNLRFWVTNPISKITTLLFALIMGFTSCQQADEAGFNVRPQPTGGSSTASKNIVEIAASNPDFSSLVAAVVKTDLAGVLSSRGLFVVFAPTNAAFAKLPAPFNNAQNIAGITSPATIAALKEILLYHVASRQQNLNGIVRANSRPAFTTVVPGNFINTLRPTRQNRPFENKVYFSRIGGKFIANGTVNVLTADVPANNGFIEIIDAVLTPPTLNIVEIASSNPAFSALTAAVVKTGFAQPLSVGLFPSRSPFAGVGANGGNNALDLYTVFAPTNAAFAKLPAPFNTAANISAITDKKQIEFLRNILRYHLIGGLPIFSSDLKNGTLPTTLVTGPAGKLVANVNGGFTIKGSGNATPSNIVIANVLGTNAVVHAIDQVLLP
jgi:uncharacterized surface protein with fasciclin (FAS1) repeats